jgi:hypothetical protein
MSARATLCPPRHLAGETLGGEELRCMLALTASRDRDPAGTDAAKSRRGGAAFICYGCLKEMVDGAANREAMRQEWEVD